MTAAHILWRRLDAPGHDACRLTASPDGGWLLAGAAAFRHEGAPAHLIYRLACDAGWRTREGIVDGWLGDQRIGHAVQRTADGWNLDGVTVRGLDACVDLDLGFTPSTNALQLRRIALDVGQAAEVPVAWLDVAAGTLSLLQQRYERRSRTEYWYEAPRFDYSAMLVVDASGFPRVYPDLWEAER